MIAVIETLSEDQIVVVIIIEKGRVIVAGTGAAERALQHVLINGQLTNRCGQSY